MPDDFKVQLSLKRGADMLNIRAGNAAEFHSLVEELADLPELKTYFPRYVVAESLQAAGGMEGEAPADEVPRLEVAGGTTSPSPSPDSGAKSALEIARQRMKGAAR